MKKSLAANWVVFCLLLGTTLALQIGAGAYQTETGNYPDEAAHFMNGLLLRDYLTHGLFQTPLHFAEGYYLNYPKIAPMMWPPFFHVAEGLFLLPGWPPHAAALVLLGLFTAWTSWRLYVLVRMLASPLLALLVSGMFLFTPVIIEMTSAVMVDVVVAALALEAIYWLAMFWASGKNRHAILFGLFAAFCCLTKGNGVSIVFAPAFLLLFTGRFDLLRRPGLYLAAGIVIALALPILVISYRLDAAIGDFGAVTAATALRRVGFYASYVQGQLGMFVFMLGLIGGLEAVRAGWQPGRSIPVAQAMAALGCSAMIFHALNPHQEIDGRYMTLAVAPLLGLLAFAVTTLGKLVRVLRARQAVQTALLGGVLLSFATAPSAFAGREPLGFSDVAQFLQNRDALAGRRILVVSDANGEGAFTSEVAIRRPNPRATVVRGTNLLVRIDWPGNHFELLFPSPLAIMQELESLHVKYLVFDASSEGAVFAYRHQVKELIATNPDRLVQIYSTVGHAGPKLVRPIVIYEVKHQTPGPPKVLRIDLHESLGRVLEQ